MSSRRRNVPRPTHLLNSGQGGDLAAAASMSTSADATAVASKLSAVVVPEGEATNPVGRVRALQMDAPMVPTGGRSADPTPEERRNRQLLFSPQAHPRDVARVRSQVVDAAMRVPYVSAEAESSVLTPLYRFAMWCLQRGSFEWSTDLTVTNIDLFVNTEMLTSAPGSRDTYRAALNRVRRGHRVQTQATKRRATSGYTETEWRLLWNAAESAGRWEQDATVLLALSGGAGLRASEVIQVDASWVHATGNRVHLTVPDPDGTFREVPVFGAAAAVIALAAQQRPTGYLLEPTHTRRANAASRVKETVSRENKHFALFSAVRARHYWLSRLLARPVSFTVIAAVAGIKSGTTLPADIAAELAVPSLHDIHTALSAVHPT